jgi:hypothetical protein
MRGVGWLETVGLFEEKSKKEGSPKAETIPNSLTIQSGAPTVGGEWNPAFPSSNRFAMSRHGLG